MDGTVVNGEILRYITSVDAGASLGASLRELAATTSGATSECPSGLPYSTLLMCMGDITVKHSCHGYVNSLVLGLCPWTRQFTAINPSQL